MRSILAVLAAGTAEHAEPRQLAWWSGSVKHSVCGQKGARETLYSKDYDQFLTRYTAKKKKLNEAIAQLVQQTQLGQYTKDAFEEVYDRTVGFQKCQKITPEELAKSPQGGPIGQIINNVRDGYKVMVRTGFVNVIEALDESGHILPDGHGCKFDGGRLRYVVLWPQDQERTGSNVPDFQSAFPYVFGPDCQPNEWKAGLDQPSLKWLGIAQEAMQCAFEPDMPNCFSEFDDDTPPEPEGQVVV
jgi:hypothetical protein